MIIVTNLQTYPTPVEADFDKWVTLTLADQKRSGDVGIRIVEATDIQTLNQYYRSKDRPTNVLAFPFEAPPGMHSNELGDIVICAEVVRQEAEAQQKSHTQHWAHITIHATLHLLGFDHQTNAQATAIETIEIQLLQQLGYSNPYEV